MRRALVVAAALAAVGLGGCARQNVATARRGLPAGDGVWFEDGVGSTEQDMEATLARAGLATVFLPAARLTREGGHWTAQQLSGPPRPFVRTNVFLVFSGDETVQQALAGGNTVDSLGDALSLAIKAALSDTRSYGRVTGVLLDLPFNPAAAGRYAALTSTLRARLPRGMPLVLSLRFSASPQDQDGMRALAAACDGFVAFVFGEGNQADPIATDALESQWWAGYATSARGVWQDASGQPREVALPEWTLSRLADDPRAEFLGNVSLKDESDQSFDVRLRSPIALDKEFSFAAGDRLSYRQPLISELIYRLGSDLAGRRFARGRVIALPGRSETERLFTLAALNDVLQGKPALPDLHLSTQTGRGFITVSAENLSPHATVISTTSNWIEIQIPSAGIRDVQTGGFDRFEVYGRDREPVTLALATTVRFFETLVQPHEQIEAARILLRRQPPKDCCATRFHLLAASGQEVLSDAPIVPAPQ